MLVECHFLFFYTAIESRQYRNKPKNTILKDQRQQNQASTPVEARQRPSVYTPQGPSTSDPSQGILPKSAAAVKSSADGSPESSTCYRSFAYESQSSSSSSSATPSPSPSQMPSSGGFVPFDNGQGVSTPGSFVPAFPGNCSNNDNALELRQQPASTSAEGNIIRSLSVPLDLSQQRSHSVLATYKCVKMIGSGGFAKVNYITEI